MKAEIINNTVIWKEEDLIYGQNIVLEYRATLHYKHVTLIKKTLIHNKVKTDELINLPLSVLPLFQKLKERKARVTTKEIKTIRYNVINAKTGEEEEWSKVFIDPEEAEEWYNTHGKKQEAQGVKLVKKTALYTEK